jgi:putative DNA modification/repair radical SAM protein
MDLSGKLQILASAAKYDASCASSESQRKRVAGRIGNAGPNGICHSFTPDGRCVSLLKILLTNYCMYDCAYCVNRISSNTPRARFTVTEVVNLTLDFYKRNYIEGLFLSSGIIQSPDYTMEQLVAVVKELRLGHKFCGYVHLKAVPGASRELLAGAGHLADRLSANIEMCSQRDLDRLAPAKQHQQIETAMMQIREVKAAAENPNLLPAGQTTQMVIGATPATDADILTKADELYRKHELRRVYYTGYSPIPHASPDLPVKPTPLIRENRLYQSDWLIRFYGFHVGELITAAEPNLSLSMDPKLAWALRNRDFFPIDVNAAPREALLRVPGFGSKVVKRILRIRRLHRLTSADLMKLHVPIKRAQPFIVTSDTRAPNLDTANLSERVKDTSIQLALFRATQESLSGEF